MPTHALCHKVTDDCQKLNINIYQNHLHTHLTRLHPFCQLQPASKQIEQLQW